MNPFKSKEDLSRFVDDACRALGMEPTDESIKAMPARIRAMKREERFLTGKLQEAERRARDAERAAVDAQRKLDLLRDEPLVEKFMAWLTPQEDGE